MKKMNRFLLFLCLFACAFSARANSDFDAWKKTFYDKALNENISQNILDTYFTEAKYLPKVIELDRAQPEFSLSFGRYMNKVISEKRVEKARKMFENHSRILGRIEELYGVPAHYLVAFWGIETNFGAVKGNINILNALSTLSFDERRSAFFSEQLLTLLKILEREDIDVPKGSWAGAFGHFQFMPTTFYQYAVDEDGDGRRDVIHSFDDALASAANYLKKMGWKEKQTWGRQVILIHPELVEYEGKSYPLSKWMRMGILRADGKQYTPEDLDIEAKLLLPEGINGPAFLTYHNFDVIKRWNRSDFYALAVVVLADKIIERPTLAVSSLPVLPNLSKDDIRFMQQFLKDKHFYFGKVDGRFGTASKNALKAYQKSHSLPADGFLSYELIENLKEAEQK